jgi:radical SAM protein with 4Fe4S-binding SPASM domain
MPERPTLLALRALGIGDLLTAVPALRALADAFPRHRRVLAAPRALVPLARLTGAVDAVVDAAPLAPLDAAPVRPDVAVNLHGRGPESHRILLARRPRRLVAFAHAEVPESAAAPVWRAAEHEVRRWCRLLEESGIPADPARLDLSPPATPAPPEVRGSTILHPGAASAARRWPPARWAAVARAERLAGHTVLLTGADEDVAVARAIATAAGLPASAVLAGRTDLGMLAAVVAAAGRVVAGDTGMAHLATALRTPLVVLFGPCSPAEWGPPPDRPWHRVLWAGAYGDPHAATPHPGLLAIRVDDVLAALASLPAPPPRHGRSILPPDATADARPPLPRELQVEVTAACNLRCRMCLVRYRPPLGRLTASMPFAAFRTLVDGLPTLERLTLQGLGEPLLAPDLPAMVGYAAARGIRVGFNTNATLLTRERAARLVDAGLDWLHVSLDGATAGTYESIRDGAAFARVRENVLALVDLLARTGARRPALALVFVAMRRNLQELPDAVRLAAAWGVGTLRVQNLAHGFTDTAPGGGYEAIRAFTAAEALWTEDDDGAARVFAEAEAVARACGVALRLPKIATRPSPRAPGEPGCDWPWRSAYVAHDGRVQPCCMVMGTERALLGDLRQTDFARTWHGPAYAAFRAALRTDAPPAVCRGCALYRGVF